MNKLKRAKLDSEYDAIEAVGKEGKEGVKYAKEYFNEQEKNYKIDAEKEKEELNKHTRDHQTYTRFLGGILLERLRDVDWPEGWTFKVAPTNEGVVMEIKTKDNRYFRTAFKAVGDGYYDLNAVNNFTQRAWNLIDKIESESKNKNGIILL